jgi:hypothetical protein
MESYLFNFGITGGRVGSRQLAVGKVYTQPIGINKDRTPPYKPKREDEEASTVLFGRQSGPFLYGDFFNGKIAMLKSCLWGTQM